MSATWYAAAHDTGPRLVVRHVCGTESGARSFARRDSLGAEGPRFAILRGTGARPAEGDGLRTGDAARRDYEVVERGMMLRRGASCEK